MIETETNRRVGEEVRQALFSAMYHAAVRAGAAIMSIYRNRDDYDIGIKRDRTPVTFADRAAHCIIKECLGPTRIPILSEEGREMHYDERRNWELFWLVDPLDGTVEFIRGNNEFTVNIALMEGGRPLGAVIYVPSLCKIYAASRGCGAYLREGVVPEDVAERSCGVPAEGWKPLPLVADVHRPVRVAVSRSHRTPETFARIGELRRRFGEVELVEQGSSYKFCLLAEGTVDYYVRTTPTYEWDTAAGELILAEAGGSTRTLGEGLHLNYNKEDLHNPWFESRSKGCPF